MPARLLHGSRPSTAPQVKRAPRAPRPSRGAAELERVSRSHLRVFQSSAAIPVPRVQHHYGARMRVAAQQNRESCPPRMGPFAGHGMGSLPDRFPVLIARRHWAVELEIRAVAKSPAAASSPCLRAAKLSCFCRLAPPGLFCFPRSHPRFPSLPSSSLNFTRHIPSSGRLAAPKSHPARRPFTLRRVLSCVCSLVPRDPRSVLTSAIRPTRCRLGVLDPSLPARRNLLFSVYV